MSSNTHFVYGFELGSFIFFHHFIQFNSIKASFTGLSSPTIRAILHLEAHLSNTMYLEIITEIAMTRLFCKTVSL